MSVFTRPIEHIDAKGCGKVVYRAHITISSKHSYPSEQPSEEYAIGLIRSLLGNPNSHGFLAERQGDILGSIFLHEFPPSRPTYSPSFCRRWYRPDVDGYRSYLGS